MATPEGPGEVRLEEALQAFGWSGATAEPVDSGLINRTYRISFGDERFILQRLHPVFRGEVNQDIDAVTEHLEARGLTTPRVVRTAAGALFHEAPDGVWRALSHLEGRTLHRLSDPAMAEEAGRLVGRFHAATADLSHDFAFTRPGAHDTDAHLERLRGALHSYGSHRHREALAPLVEAVLVHGESLSPLPALPARIVHGDLKVSNLLFDDQSRAVALVDLDTLARERIPVELGDAFRSWCNPAGEDDPDRVRFDRELFRGAVTGYAAAAGGLLEPAEISSLVLGVETIALELASRFALDAFEERYFGWDHARYPDASTHNAIRARGQLALARSVADGRRELSALVRAAFS